jgi:HEAT repeat protein
VIEPNEGALKHLILSFGEEPNDGARRRIVEEIAKAVARNVSELKPFLKSSEENSRIAAARAAALLGPKATSLTEALARAIESSEAGQYEAADALVAIGASSVPATTRLLRSADYRVRLRATYILNGLGPKARAALPALIQLLSDNGSPSLAGDASEVLGKIGPPAIKPLCANVQQGISAPVGSRRYRISVYAILSLGRMESSGRPAIDCVLRSLKSSNPELREVAAEALGKIGYGSDSVARALVALFEDPDRSVRNRAAIALKDVGGVVYPYLRGAILSARREVRAAATVALSWLEKSPELITMLYIAAHGEDAKLRFSATRQLASYSLLDDESGGQP